MRKENLSECRTIDFLENIYNYKFEELDKIILEKTKNIGEIDDRESIIKSIIMKEMYIQGFKDGVNLIIECIKSK